MSSPQPLSRRTIMSAAAIASLARPAAPASVDRTAPYTLSVNIEIMFPRTMPRAQRMEAVAAHGMKAYSFWTASAEEREAMLAVQRRTNLKCASIVGSGKPGQSTGLTEPGFEEAYLEAITENCEISKNFGGPDLIIFVGQVQDDVAPETQHRQIVAGLKKAGDIAQKYGVYLVLEALNRVESPKMSVLTARENFRIISEVEHPHVKVDFDMYHLQLSEGNLTNNLKLGLKEGWIRLVQIGEVPGRKEPGTGEIDTAYMFRILREAGYNGYVDMEHGTSTTPEHAMDVVTKLSLEN
ncbi:MAG: TIM barrel protein [Bryobacteraceae bacterium]